MRKLLAFAFFLSLLVLSATPAAASFVCRLNPYGDNFLSLRTGPGTNFPEIDRLGPNTGLQVMRGAGAWLLVRTDAGATGWVFSRYVCD